MRPCDVKPGLIVAVNDLPDGQIYIVKERVGFLAALYYVSGGRWVAGGAVDVGILKKPTKAQLENELREAWTMASQASLE